MLTQDNHHLAQLKGCTIGPFTGLGAKWSLRPTSAQPFLKRPLSRNDLGLLLAECFVLPDANEVAPYVIWDSVGAPCNPQVCGNLQLLAERKGYAISWVRYSETGEVYRATRTAKAAASEPDLFFDTSSTKVTQFLHERPDAVVGEERVRTARAFALFLHGNQKYGELPYIVHIDDVLELATYYGLSDDERVAACLHDSYEDTDVRPEEVMLRYGQDVHMLVYSVTGEGANRAEQRAVIIERLKAYPKAINLKLLDRLANVKRTLAEGKLNLVAMYRKEMPDYDPLFRQGHPEAYAELCRLLAQ
jgi:hypothetical protein